MTLPDRTIQDTGTDLRAGRSSSVAVTQAHLERIGLRDPVYRAFVALTEERALRDAARADAELAQGIDRGPLHGIPVALKDLIDVAGLPTTCCSRTRPDHLAGEDAAVARRLARAGAVLLGKLATYEFALVGPSFDLPRPPATNPWSLAHITGGSSSGCASAVAGGLVRTTIGSDTGGSLRSPACYCGVVGLKPTFGTVPRGGVFPLSPSLDHIGPISATVTEAALTLDAIAGPDPDALPPRPAARCLGRGIEGLRIAYARDWFARDPATMPEIVAAMDDAASQLSLLGARIEDVVLPDYALFEACGAVILHAEALEIHQAALRTSGADYGRAALQSLASGACLTPGDVARARRLGEALKARLERDVFSSFDALVTANTLGVAPPVAAFDGGTVVWAPMRTLPFNLTGHPALALPIGLARGLPMGMQIVGKAFDEAQICRIGDAFERSTDHAVLKPPPLRHGERITRDMQLTL